MKDLEPAQLFKQNLVRVGSKALVRRYNEALLTLGLEATGLTRFHIDALGYSPEIAEERGEFYLSHGPANPLGVIVSPNQQRAPLLAPVASFYGRLLADYYERFSREIADTTKDAGLWLDFDQGLSQFKNPQNLLLLNGVSVHSGAGALSEAAAQQEHLVARFKESPSDWFDPAFRQVIIESAKAHGDLRERRLVIPETRFTNLDSFYAPVFGGAFVVRAPSGNDYLILASRDIYDELGRKGSALYLHDPELVEQLYAEALISVDLDYYRENMAELRAVYAYLLADTLFADDPDLELAKLSAPQRRQRLRRLKDDLPDTLLELEYLISKLEADTKVKASQLSGALIRLLLRPHPDLSEPTREVVLHILARLEPRDILRLYETDKQHFLELYGTWSEGKRKWALTLIGGK